MKRVVAGLSGLLLLTMIISCDQQAIYDHFEHIEGANWHWDDIVSFEFEVEDTVGVYDMLIQLRHTTEYPMSNLYMFVKVEGPSGQELHDTIQYIIAEPSGRWIGKGIGQMKELAYLYRTNAMFPEKGSYTMHLEQAMRLEEVPVTELGLRIVPKNP